ncbi:hypothetical protein [Ensifer sesbaniae]|nr:hypothetical protein [Ensifer sesbaniae]
MSISKRILFEGDPADDAARALIKDASRPSVNIDSKSPCAGKIG